MVQALITINGTPGSDDDLPINTLVTLGNQNNGGEVSYLWSIVNQPPGTADTLSATNVLAPTFTPKKEGTYLLRLVVNQSLASETYDQAIVAIRFLKSYQRAPAAGETDEDDLSNGWETAVNNVIRDVDDLLLGTDIAAVADVGIAIGNIVYINGESTIKSGLPGEELLPLVSLADPPSDVSAIGVVTQAADGGAVTTGTIVRVRFQGLVTIADTFTPGDLVYLDDTTGTFASSGSRPVGLCTSSSGGSSSIYVSPMLGTVFSDMLANGTGRNPTEIVVNGPIDRDSFYISVYGATAYVSLYSVVGVSIRFVQLYNTIGLVPPGYPGSLDSINTSPVDTIVTFEPGLYILQEPASTPGVWSFAPATSSTLTAAFAALLAEVRAGGGGAASGYANTSQALASTDRYYRIQSNVAALTFTLPALPAANVVVVRYIDLASGGNAWTLARAGGTGTLNGASADLPVAVISADTLYQVTQTSTGSTFVPIGRITMPAGSVMGRAAATDGAEAPIVVGTDEGLWNDAGVITSHKVQTANMDDAVVTGAKIVQSGTLDIGAASPTTTGTVTAARFLVTSAGTLSDPAQCTSDPNSGRNWDATEGIQDVVNGVARLQLAVSGQNEIVSPGAVAGVAALVVTKTGFATWRVFPYNATPEGVISAGVGATCIDCTNGRLYLKRSGSGNTGWVQIDRCESGTYTPTGTAVTNLDSVTPQVARWVRVGDQIFVSGTTAADPTASGTIVFDLSFPVASALTAANQVAGNATHSSLIAGAVNGNATDDRATFTVANTSTTAVNITYLYGYTVV